MDVATGVWASSPQRAAMAVDRLMALRLVSAAAIARWVRAQRAGLLCGQRRCHASVPCGPISAQRRAPWRTVVQVLHQTCCRIRCSACQISWKEGLPSARQTINPAPCTQTELVDV